MHESVHCPNAKLIKLQGLQLHYTNDDLYHYLLKRLRYSHEWANDKYKHGKKIGLIGLNFRSIFSFVREYMIRGQFLAGGYGFIASVAIAWYTWNKYLLLWQFSQEKEYTGD